MIGLDIMAAWRLDSPVRSPATVCPICGAAVATYDAALDEGKCDRGHEWHICPIHHRTLAGPARGPETCSCHRSLAISTGAAQ